MNDTDWYRRTHWTPEVAAQFEERLARSRAQRSEYLRIQALTLADAGNPEFAATAISLAKRQLELKPEGISAAQMHATIAKAFGTLGDTPAAIEAFRCAIRLESSQRNVRGCHYIDFAWFVATQRLAAQYKEALTAMQQNKEDRDLVIPRTQYRYFGALAMISADTGDLEGAKRMAQNALSAANQDRGPFWRYPALGLVGEAKDGVHAELSRLAKLMS